MLYIYTDRNDISGSLLEELKNSKEDVKIYFNVRKILKIRRKLTNLFNIDSRIYMMVDEIFIKKYIKSLTLKGDETLIFFDYSPLLKDMKVIVMLRKLYPNLKLKLWLWNSLNHWKQKENFNEVEESWKVHFDEVLTYNLKDSEENGYTYVNQFYSEELVIRIKEQYKGEKVEKAVFFIGIDKGRVDYLDKIRQLLEKNKVKWNFKIVKESGKDYSKYTEFQKDSLIDKGIGFQEMLKDVYKSEVLLDLLQEGESGMTLRVVESLFFEKKLITNNKVVSKMDFYNPKNIYILKSIEELNDIDKEFFNAPYEKVSEEILKKYTIKNWAEEVAK